MEMNMSYTNNEARKIVVPVKVLAKPTDSLATKNEMCTG